MDAAAAADTPSNQPDEFVSKQLPRLLTQRGYKVFVGSQCLGATLVLVVPDAQRLVVSAAHDELATRVEHDATHPVIMANLREGQ